MQTTSLTYSLPKMQLHSTNQGLLHWVTRYIFWNEASHAMCLPKTRNSVPYSWSGTRCCILAVKFNHSGLFTIFTAMQKVRRLDRPNELWYVLRQRTCMCGQKPTAARILCDGVEYLSTTLSEEPILPNSTHHPTLTT